jgi:hypothetical protein
MTTPLPAITALIRAGALDQAARLFREGGYDVLGGGHKDHSAALAVKGRLFKERAFQALGAERRALLVQAADAYAGADASAPAPYLLMNVAACRMLAGERDAAREAATAVIARLNGNGTHGETPFWLAATRGEAHLILGEVDSANANLALAISLNPDAYEDHAAALRQCARLIAAEGGDASWLDAHRPPASLHFAGHLGVDAAASADLGARVAALLDQQRVGFGYGALAAGSDILIAEALLARGAALHVVLPAPVDVFRALSVTPYGEEWGARFEACLAAAETLHVATGIGAEAFEPLATAQAAEMAMGAAQLNARRLESRALQLLVIDDGDGPFGGGRATARDGATWQRTGAAQFVLVEPRSADVPPSASRHEGRADRALMALLHVGFAGLDQADDTVFAGAHDDLVTPYWAEASHLPGQPALAQTQGNARILAFDDVPAAAAFARALHALDPPGRFPLTISGHYGLVHRAQGGVAGPLVSRLTALAARSLPGSITLSEAFATVLALSPGPEARTEDMGDHDGQRLFALQ